MQEKEPKTCVFAFFLLSLRRILEKCLMKKHFLNRINLVLGVCSLALAGCHSSKQVAGPDRSRPMMKYGVPKEIIAMYGVQMPEDTVVTAPDTTALPQPLPQPEQPAEPVMTKYGIPYPIL